MRFSELALYFSRLEETSSRNALVGILAELFGQTPPEDVAPTCYLLQGRLAPSFEPIEIGLGPNYVAEAASAAYGRTRGEVLGRFDELGVLATPRPSSRPNRAGRRDQRTSRRCGRSSTVCSP